MYSQFFKDSLKQGGELICVHISNVLKNVLKNWKKRTSAYSSRKYITFIFISKLKYHTLYFQYFKNILFEIEFLS